jgi:hypothetical protein
LEAGEFFLSRFRKPVYFEEPAEAAAISARPQGLSGHKEGDCPRGASQPRRIVLVPVSKLAESFAPRGCSNRVGSEETIEGIMTHRIARNMDFGKKLLLRRAVWPIG